MSTAPEQKNMFQKFWTTYDKNNNDLLDYEELYQLLQHLSQLFKDKTITENSKLIFELIDQDKDGMVTKSEVSNFFQFDDNDS